MADLLVVGPDPRFGGGSHAHAEALVEAARALGRDAELVFVPHPTLRPEQRLSPVDRVEPLRLLRGSRALVPALRAARTVWVASPLAHHGLAATRSGRRYAVWAGTSLADERRGRLPGLPTSRRAAALLNAPALGAIERRVLRGAARVYATGPASRAAVARAGGLDESRVGLLPLPVDLDRFAPLPDDEWTARLERPVLAFVGRTDDPRKNLALALAALPLIRRRVPAATLRVIGPGAPPPATDGVEALGEVPSVAEPLREAALLLLPARQEGFGIAAAEALACGVPVLATPSGGPEELLRPRAAGWSRTAGRPPSSRSARSRSWRTLVPSGDAAPGARARRGEHAPQRLRDLLAAALADLG